MAGKQVKGTLESDGSLDEYIARVNPDRVAQLLAAHEQYMAEFKAQMGDSADDDDPIDDLPLDDPGAGVVAQGIVGNVKARGAKGGA
jgi:hypothetical protein